MSLPKDILPQVTAAELDAFSTIGGEERLIAFVNRFRELERERIIKLLEPLAKHDDDFCYFNKQLVCYPEDCHAYSYEYAIELIKGEQK